MTRGRLIARVASAIGLDDTVGAAERTLMEEWAQQAVDDVLQKTHARMELGDLNLLSGISDYRLDATVLAVDDRTVSDDIQVVTTDEIYDLRRANASGGSLVRLAVEGDLALVYPTPSADYAIRFMFVKRPTRMSSDAHDPMTETYGGLPSESDAELALEYFMLWRAAEYDDKKTPMGPKEYREAYDGLLGQMRKNKRHKARRGLGPARVGYPGTTPSFRNDVYPQR